MPDESRYLDCSDCDKSFPFSIAQQELYAELGYDDQPKRCPGCRRMEKSRRAMSAVEVRSPEYPLNAEAPTTENGMRSVPMKPLMYSAWSTERAAR